MSGGVFPGGRLYRSGTFDFLTPAEVAGLASSLGFVTVIDLRTPSERERSHRPFPRKVEVFQIPFLTRSILIGSTRSISHPPPLPAVIWTCSHGRDGSRSDPSSCDHTRHSSMVIHCSACKDRTGIVTALLLAIAGVTDEAIAADYAKSGPDLPLLASDPATAASFAPDPPNEYETSPETMRLFLKGVRQRYGSSERLAVTSNVEADHLQWARAALLAPQ